MTVLSELARAEWTAKEAARVAAEQAKAAAELNALRTAARDAVVAALKKQDGSLLTWQATGLKLKEESVATGQAIASDGVVNLIVRRQSDGDWVVSWGIWDGGPAWVRGERITSLADLGPHLPAAP